MEGRWGWGWGEIFVYNSLFGSKGIAGVEASLLQCGTYILDVVFTKKTDEKDDRPTKTRG